MGKDRGPYARPFEFEGWFKDTMKGFCGAGQRKHDPEWEKMAHEWQAHFMKLQREQLVFVRNMIDTAIEHLDKKNQQA